MQEAFAIAVQAWPSTGIPNRPAAWITTTARRRAIDRLRGASVSQTHRAPGRGAPDPRSARLPSPTTRSTRCPTTSFASSSSAATPRWRSRRRSRSRSAPSPVCRPRRSLVRSSSPSRRWGNGSCGRSARSKRRASRSRCRAPDQLPDRLDAVLAGRLPRVQRGLQRRPRAMRSCGASCAPRRSGSGACSAACCRDEPEVEALLALMLLHHSRRDTRIDADGLLAPLEEQDRSRWDREAIEEGAALVESALRRGRPGPLQVQAVDRGAARAGADDGGHRLVADRRALRRAQQSMAVACRRAEPRRSRSA